MLVSNCTFDDNALYDVENHVWARVHDTIAEVGVDSVILWLSGPLRSLNIVKPREFLKKGKILGSLESSRHFDVIRSPVTGWVEEVNQEALLQPFIVNKDPYGRGWLVKMKLSQPGELQSLKSINEASAQLAQMIRNLNIHCFKEFPEEELYEIGVECSAALVRLNDLLSTSKPGTVVHIVTDDPLADVEMVRWADQTGNLLLESKAENNLTHFLVKKRE